VATESFAREAVQYALWIPLAAAARAAGCPHDLNTIS